MKFASNISAASALSAVIAELLARPPLRWIASRSGAGVVLGWVRRRLVSVSIGIILGLLVVAIVLWTQLEKRFIFFPSSEIGYTPGQAGLTYEDVVFATDDGINLHGWFLPGSTELTFLWFHGNGGNISHRVGELAMLHHRLGVNLLIFDYRGYGRSQGRPSEQGTYRDARAALRYLLARPDVSRENIVYFGRSLGSAVAVELAVEHPPAALILVSPIASVAHMARVTFPYLPIGWLIGNRYNSLARIPTIQRPLLILHGERDETVPLSQGRMLYEAANQPKHFKVLSQAGHDDTYDSGGAVYWNALQEFLAELPGGQTDLTTK